MEEIIEKLKKQAILLADRNLEIGCMDDEFKDNIEQQVEIVKTIVYANAMASAIGGVTALEELQKEVDKWK